MNTEHIIIIYIQQYPHCLFFTEKNQGWFFITAGATGTAGLEPLTIALVARSQGGTLPSFGGTLQDNGNIPAHDAGIPASNAGTPANSTGVPANDTGIPADNAGTPARNTGIPANDAGVPARDTGIPVNNAGIPVKQEMFTVIPLPETRAGQGNALLYREIKVSGTLPQNAGVVLLFNVNYEIYD